MRRALILSAAFALASAAQARDDAGAAKSPAAYLELIPSARAASMGYAEGAVVPTDATDAANPATLALINSQILSATTGSLGVGRRLVNAGYVFPFHWNASRHFFRVDQDIDESPRQEWDHALMPTDATRYAIFLSGTSFGFDSIPGSTEFGDPAAPFDDKEKNYSLALAGRPYQNVAFGVSGRYLQQTLPGARATGVAINAGAWYGLPAFRLGSVDLGLGFRDNGHLNWTVNDPDLGVTYDYKEGLATKTWAGAAYRTPSGRWMLALDAVKPTAQHLRLNAGLETELGKVFYLRAGANDFSPTVGCGLVLSRQTLNLIIDYALVPNPDSMETSQWFTFSLRFLPVAVPTAERPVDNNGHHHLGREAVSSEAEPVAPVPSAKPVRAPEKPAPTSAVPSSPQPSPAAVRESTPRAAPSPSPTAVPSPVRRNRRHTLGGR